VQWSHLAENTFDSGHDVAKVNQVPNAVNSYTALTRIGPLLPYSRIRKEWCQGRATEKSNWSSQEAAAAELGAEVYPRQVSNELYLELCIDFGPRFQREALLFLEITHSTV